MKQKVKFKYLKNNEKRELVVEFEPQGNEVLESLMNDKVTELLDSRTADLILETTKFEGGNEND